MSFDTYANLQVEVLAKLNRASDTDAATRCPSWIALAEDEMRLALTRIMVRQGETKDPAFSINAEFINLPSGFIKARSLLITSVSPRQILEYVTPTQADKWDAFASADLPKLYTIQGNQLRVFPPPNTTYTGTLTYYTLPSLSASNPTNWMLAAHPKIYFRAALAEAYEYYDNVESAIAASADRERLLSALYTSDGADQQGSNLRMRTDSGTP